MMTSLGAINNVAGKVEVDKACLAGRAAACLFEPGRKQKTDRKVYWSPWYGFHVYRKKTAECSENVARLDQQALNGDRIGSLPGLSLFSY